MCIYSGCLKSKIKVVPSRRNNNVNLLIIQRIDIFYRARKSKHPLSLFAKTQQSSLMTGNVS